MVARTTLSTALAFALATRLGRVNAQDGSVTGATSSPQLEPLNAFSGIPVSSIKGFRAPLLSYSADTLTQLHSANFTYDSSATSATPANDTDTDAYWPYTLDYGFANDCLEVTDVCSGQLKLPGLWEIPMYATFDEKGAAGIHLMDVWLDSTDPNDALNWMKATFLTHYNGNRQPFGLYTHPIHLAVGYPGVTDPNNTRAMVNTFLDWTQTFDDVWLVSNEQLLEWVKAPVTNANISSVDALKCSTPSVSDKICNGIEANEQGLLLNCPFIDFPCNDSWRVACRRINSTLTVAFRPQIDTGECGGAQRGALRFPFTSKRLCANLVGKGSNLPYSSPRPTVSYLMAPTDISSLPREVKAHILVLVARQEEAWTTRIAALEIPKETLDSERKRHVNGIESMSLVSKEWRAVSAQHIFHTPRVRPFGTSFIRRTVTFSRAVLRANGGSQRNNEKLLDHTLSLLATLPQLRSIEIDAPAVQFLFGDGLKLDPDCEGEQRMRVDTFVKLGRNIEEIELVGFDAEGACRVLAVCGGTRRICFRGKSPTGADVSSHGIVLRALSGMDHLRRLELDQNEALFDIDPTNCTPDVSESLRVHPPPISSLQFKTDHLLQSDLLFFNLFSATLKHLQLEIETLEARDDLDATALRTPLGLSQLVTIHVLIESSFDSEKPGVGARLFQELSSSPLQEVTIRDGGGMSIDPQSGGVLNVLSSSFPTLRRLQITLPDHILSFEDTTSNIPSFSPTAKYTSRLRAYSTAVRITYFTMKSQTSTPCAISSRIY
ncbi:hypothetical protein P7C70_g5669, partial [Phenoliferia sp. Uapishka_3]